MRRIVTRFSVIIVILFVSLSCDSYNAKKAVKKEVEEFGFEVKKIELEKVKPGEYEGKVYLEKSILGLISVIPVEAEKVDGEWEVSLDLL